MKLCKLTCPNCGGTLKMEITKNNTQVCCPYCRQEFYFDNEKKEYNVNVNKKVSKKYINVAETIRARTEAKDKMNVTYDLFTGCDNLSSFIIIT